jgi:hypothetical protein
MHNSKISEEVVLLKNLIKTIIVKIFDGKEYLNDKDYQEDIHLFEDELINGTCMSMALSLSKDQVSKEMKKLSKDMTENIQSIKTGFDELRKIQNSLRASELN